MKVLQIIPTYKPAYVYGGPIMSVSKLCETLSLRDDLTVHVVTTNANGETHLDVATGVPVTVDGVQVTYFPRVGGDPHQRSPELWRYLRRHVREYDVVHLHSWWNLLAVVSLWICLRRGRKVVFSPRGMLSPYILEHSNARIKSLLQGLVGKRLLARTRFHATADQETAECTAVIPGWKGYMIPNIIELPPYPLQPPANARFTLGFLSRIHPKKGLDLLFRAAAGLDFPWVLRIAGDGDPAYLKELEALAAALGISDRVEWAGWKDPAAKFTELQSYDLLVLPSHNENFANVVLESLHMGTPVCLSRYVGLSGFVFAHGLGWICDTTEASLRRSLEEAYAAGATRAGIRARARGVIDAHFSPGVLTARYAEMYADALASM